MVDVVYIAACANDARLTRICVASMRRFYPDIPIRLLPGGKLDAGMVSQMRRYWNVEVANIPSGDYGWGFVKLEPLFGPPGERFLVLDSDTVITGPVLDMWTKSSAEFLVNDENPSEAVIKQVYYDWEKIYRNDQKAHAPKFVFNSGQWFGTAGKIARHDFSFWVEWAMPRRLRHSDGFMPGDQGVLNYVLNQKAAVDSLQVERKKMMLWPGDGMQGFDRESVVRRAAPALVVHWAGMKKARHRDMVGSDLLDFFEKQYYQRLPFGRERIFFDGFKDVLYQWFRSYWTRTRLFFRYKIKVRFLKT